MTAGVICVVIAAVGLIVGLFFGLPYLQRRRMEAILVTPAKIEVYPDDNVCLEYFRSKLNPDKPTVKMIVNCENCGLPLTAAVPATYRRDGRWLIRSTPLKFKIKCVRCKEIFATETKLLSFLFSSPPIQRFSGPAPK